MIKLYAYPGACSLAPHILLEELGLPYEIKFLKLDDNKMREEIKKLNPMGQVPTMVTEEGYPLTEGVAIMYYLLSKKPNNLFPESGKDRFKAFEWMNFIATTLHKAYGPLFRPSAFSDNETHFEVIKRVGLENMKNLLQVTESKFPDGDYCIGENFTVVDAYLFFALNALRLIKLDLAPYKKLNAFMTRMRQRPSVTAALKQEGLI
ncbi:MAG: glutathione S-transferase family protein [Deltaproteobacteria bacterium]|nr:glutathione S-transferase family protein [Deltaproteobacteria bacterium]